MNPICRYAFLLAVVVCGASVSAAPGKDSCGKLDLKTDPFTCCTIPKLLDVTVVTACFEKYPIDPNTPPPKGAISPSDCMSECILNTTGIYNRKGDVDSKKLTSVFTDSLPQNSPWLSVVQRAIRECTAKSGRKSAEFDRAVAESKKAGAGKGGQPVCHPEASFLVDCIHTTVFSECPTSLRSTATDCNAIWQFLKSCPFSALRQ